MKIDETKLVDLLEDCIYLIETKVQTDPSETLKELKELVHYFKQKYIEDTLKMLKKG